MVHSFFHTPLHAQLRRKDICELAPLYQPGGGAHVIDLPKFGELKSPYFSGTISLYGGIDSVWAETRRGCSFRCSLGQEQVSFRNVVDLYLGIDL